MVSLANGKVLTLADNDTASNFTVTNLLGDTAQTNLSVRLP